MTPDPNEANQQIAIAPVLPEATVSACVDQHRVFYRGTRIVWLPENIAAPPLTTTEGD